MKDNANKDWLKTDDDYPETLVWLALILMILSGLAGYFGL